MIIFRHIEAARLLHLARRSYHSSGALHGRERLCVAIRREDASIWERRAPLAPMHVEKLTRQGVHILIQPSNRRAYPLQSYIRAGAQVKEDISEARVILGVKQVPVDLLLPSKTYCFFSHTIKAQEANMPLLDAVLDRNIRLIDYERMVDDNDQRVVAFGRYAGVAGMINILHGIGLRLLALGHHTPFMHIGPAHNYRNAGNAKQAIRDAGYEIALGKLPRSIGPLTFVFTGSGNVSQGAQEVFNELPIEYVEPKDLREVAEGGSTNKIYGSIVTRSDHLMRKRDVAMLDNVSSRFTDGFNSQATFDSTADYSPSSVDMAEYSQYPERYYSTFSTKIAPYASVILNGVYWPPNAPRLLTIPDAKRLQKPIKFRSLPESGSFRLNQGPIEPSIGSPSLPHRLIAICDISADPGGSIEFMQDCTTIDNPFCLYDAETNKSSESFAGNGILICSIDNMPTQLPLEATDMFGNLLYPYIMDIVKSDAQKPTEEEQFSNVVKRAIIASNGSLAPSYRYIQELRKRQSVSKTRPGSPNSKQVLVLGAGHVSGPLIEHLCRDSNVNVKVVSSLDKDMKAHYRHAEKHNNLESIVLDVTQKPEALSGLIKESDLVVSLLPYGLHPMIARTCIEAKTNMLTASYLTPEMRELDEAAKNSGITVVNEVGLDPGIDHLLAKQIIDQVTNDGGRVTSFVSYCCGLPTPEHADNPLGYKFGWNPIGAFAVTMNGAKWLEDDQIREVQPGYLMDYVQPVKRFLRGFSLEAFPNRDSTHYQSLYNLPDAKTIIRGSLRYQGFSDTIKALRMMGLMDRSPHPCLQRNSGAELTWRQLISELLGHSQELSQSNLNNLVYDKVGQSDYRLQAIRQLGLFEDEPVAKFCTPFDTIREHLIKRYAFREGENDMIIMRINIDIEWPDRTTEEKSLTMVVYGDPKGFSAMAKTVGYPAAIAAKMVLEGEIQTKGMMMPLTPEVYHPMLIRLKDEGIFCLSCQPDME